VLTAHRSAFLNAEREIGPEVSDAALLTIPVATAAIVVTKRSVIGQTLGDLSQNAQWRGVYLVSLKRGSEPMPREPWTSVERGDVLHVTGGPDDVERVSAYAGFVERDLAKTDLTILAAGVAAGMLAGLLKVVVGGVSLGLGTAGSILVAGLITGWARSRNPVFGAIPEPAQRLLMDIGLIVFIAVVGLQAGPHAVEAYQVSGGAFFARILVAGMIVTVMPLAVGAIVARYVLKMSPLMILGGLAGAQTCTPGLSALRDATGSNISSIAYTVPYAVNNIILTIWGPVVVAIVHAMRG
jgi:putative transport protein